MNDFFHNLFLLKVSFPLKHYITIKNTQAEIGPHAFAIYGTGTRTIILNCKIISKGGDTVSLWNYKNGMYYHAGCTFEGSVDFVCPRGWCFIKKSKFFEEKTATASIWHAGGYNINQKFVLKNCSFDGVKNFELGRHHYEAQFYLINCRFSKNLDDKPIYRVVYKDSTQNRPFNWGERDYFYNCIKEGGGFDWFNNNLNSAAGSPKPEDITPLWTFDGIWNPESITSPAIKKFKIHKNYVLFFFDEPITVIGNPVLKSNSGKIYLYRSGAGSDTIKLDCSSSFSEKDLKGLRIIEDGKMIGTKASINERKVNFKLTETEK